jgi:nucleoside-triphosphatase THEP1
VVRGEPGVGKTALLDYVVDPWRRAGALGEVRVARRGDARSGIIDAAVL